MCIIILSFKFLTKKYIVLLLTVIFFFFYNVFQETEKFLFLFLLLLSKLKNFINYKIY